MKDCSWNTEEFCNFILWFPAQHLDSLVETLNPIDDIKESIKVQLKKKVRKENPFWSILFTLKTIFNKKLKCANIFLAFIWRRTISWRAVTTAAVSLPLLSSLTALLTFPLSCFPVVLWRNRSDHSWAGIVLLLCFALPTWMSNPAPDYAELRCISDRIEPSENPTMKV